MARYVRGRKLKLTKGVQDKLCACFSIGANVKIACLSAGISDASYFSWLKQGRAALAKLEKDSNVELTKSEIKYLKLLDKVEEAQSIVACQWLSTIDQASMTDPNWARFMLKVRYEGYNEIVRQELDVTTGGEPVTFRVTYDDDVKRDFEKTPQRAIESNTDEG